MGRNQFDTQKNYAAKLNNIVKRPIENSPNCGFALLRLEFAIYEPLKGKILRSFGSYACRELIIGSAVAGSKDASILAYAHALKLSGQSIDDPATWELLKAKRPWIEIKFGPVAKVDFRQPFAKIARFDPTGWKIEEYGFAPDKEWVTVQQAAKFFDCSLSTMRRRVDKRAQIHGEKLLTFTDGGQRRINLKLLQALLDE